MRIEDGGIILGFTALSVVFQSFSADEGMS